MSIRDNLGGGSAGSVLDTLEEIEANTEAGKAAGALAVKELSDSLGGLQFGVDQNGNYGYIKAGADSVTPFKGVYQGIYADNTKIECGFKPTNVLIIGHGITENTTIKNHVEVAHFDYDNQVMWYYFEGSFRNGVALKDVTSYVVTVENDGFTIVNANTKHIVCDYVIAWN